FQLKKGFRELYGITIFGFIRSQRMEQAARLMKMEGYNVSETASIIGYSNFSNFTVAFRKHFGCNPIEYLKDMKERKYSLDCFLLPFFFFKDFHSNFFCR